MGKYFLRPFFGITDSFLPFRRVITPTYRLRILQNPTPSTYYNLPEKNDPHALFEQFFKENQIKSENEKEFFQKHFPEKVEEKFDPFKVLEVNNNATLDEVKEAYRKMAIKYHPKGNTSPQAEAKFADVAKAYQTILQSQAAKQEDKLGFKSFFQEFDKEVSQIFNPKVTQQVKTEKQSKNGKKDEVSKDSHFGELYSESSHYQSVNGQQTKFVAEKIYKKDGKLMKVIREEKLKDDGNVEITQTIDNGQQVKKKTFTQDTKKLTN